MRINRIDFEGREGRYATASRKRDSEWIEVILLSPDLPEGREHHVTADCEDDIRSMAGCLQYHLDGYRGTGSDIHDYYLELLKLSDI